MKYALFILTLALGFAAAGQNAPNPGDSVVSPQVLSGDRLRFSIYAPAADSVALRGDWIGLHGYGKVP
ncbi:MAG TPA: hypothetical protein VNE41_08570 [Chitinophagaceae bacterium]|nr:hypothetical protein [Chitinophagaceae bacterium]